MDRRHHVKSTTSRASSDDVEDSESLTSATSTRRLSPSFLLLSLLSFFSFFLNRRDADDEDDTCRRSCRSFLLSLFRCLSSSLPLSSAAKSRSSSALRESAAVADEGGGRRGARSSVAGLGGDLAALAGEGEIERAGRGVVDEGSDSMVTGGCAGKDDGGGNAGVGLRVQRSRWC